MKNYKSYLKKLSQNLSLIMVIYTYSFFETLSSVLCSTRDQKEGYFFFTNPVVMQFVLAVLVMFE